MRRLAADLFRLAVFVTCFFAARSTLADHYVVPTGSMRPTVQIGDRVVVNHLAYDVRLPFIGTSLVRTDAPARGQVVTLTSPENGERLLKRVVAVPGDTVLVRGGRIFINEAPVEEPNVRLTAGGGPDFGPAVVPADRYLVMGDNRGDSHDGRAFGFVDRDAITGHAIGVWWRDGRPLWRGL